MLSIKIIIVSYMGRKIAAEVEGFLKHNNEIVAIINVPISNYKTRNKFLLSLETGYEIHNFMSVDNNNLSLLNKLYHDYNVVKDIINS